MARIRRPLNPQAVKKADDEYYRKHPEKVVDGKRQAIDPDKDPELAAEWRELYVAEAKKTETKEKAKTQGKADKPGVYEDKPESDKAEKECDQDEPKEEDYLHVFVLVPGTTRPVNNLFDFAAGEVKDHSAGRAYWGGEDYPDFIPSLKELRQLADEQNAGDESYHSELYLNFSWSGENNHHERLKAGRKLAKSLWQRFSRWRSRQVYFHLIGHSHGGNVINNAINTLDGSDPNIKFGDRWFIKNVVYLSTPFFQLIEQPGGHRIHSSAFIYNIRNYYDLTQLCIADFVVLHASEGALSQLRPKVERIKASMKALGDLGSGLSGQIKAVALSYGAYLLQQAKDEIPFYDNSKAETKARREFEAKKRDLVNDIAGIKRNIDKLADDINSLLDKLIDFLQGARSSRNARRIDQLLELLVQIKSKVKYCSNNSQKIVDHARRFELGKLILVLLDIVEKLLAAIAAVLENDRIYEIIVITALNILQFFDDTLQDNKHYKGLAGFTAKLEEVDSVDPYNKKSLYGRFRGTLELHEKRLHGHMGRSVAAFSRSKWNGFSHTHRHLTAMLKSLLAQVAGGAARPYKEYPANVAKVAGGIAKVNGWADTVISDYDGGDVTRYVTSIQKSSQVIGSFVNDLIDRDLRLYKAYGESPMSADTPGTIPYLAVVAHSISRQKFSDETRDALVATVTK